MSTAAAATTRATAQLTPHQIHLKLLRIHLTLLESQILESQSRLKDKDLVFTNKDLIKYKNFQLALKIDQVKLLLILHAQQASNEAKNEMKAIQREFDIDSIQADIARLETRLDSLKSQEEKPMKLDEEERETMALLLKKYQSELDGTKSQIKNLQNSSLTLYAFTISLVALSLPFALFYLVYSLIQMEEIETTQSLIATWGTALYFGLVFGVVIYWDAQGIRKKNLDEPVKRFWGAVWKGEIEI